MFPTDVGMNRLLKINWGQILNVPHRRGDEPVILGYIYIYIMFPTDVGMNLHCLTKKIL